jgi:hypothetical protein
MRATRSIVAIALVLVSLGSLTPLIPEASAGTGCPEIEGSSNPTDPSYVRGLFWDVYGCRVPLREGVGHVPWKKGDFGYQHIAARRDGEGAANHELTPFALGLWANAMVKAGATKGVDFVCYQTHYSIAGGQKRTMQVFVHYGMLGDYRYKGIITGYWVEGHRDWC